VDKLETLIDLMAQNQFLAIKEQGKEEAAVALWAALVEWRVELQQQQAWEAAAMETDPFENEDGETWNER
jgi:hypothetical protein